MREPELSEEELKMLDGIARQLEVQRLKGMQVLLELDAVAEEDQDSPLSAKFVYTWRRKEYQGSPIWLRRARLVAREFNFMEVNDNVFSPASPTLLTKLLPLLQCSSIYGANSVIGSLDISDAFLMVPQERPRKIKLQHGEMSYLIAKCLPGQRAGARRWCDHVVQVLTEGAGMEVSDECPTLLRDKRGRGCLLMHVDDMTFSGTEHWVEDVLIANLKQRYKVTYTIAKKAGDEFSFLKRAFTLSDDGGIVVSPSASHINGLVEKFEEFTQQRAKIVRTPGYEPLCKPDLSVELEFAQAKAYRSFVGMIMYISHHRADIAYHAKTLASFLKRPTELAWSGMTNGYLKGSPSYGMKMNKVHKGTTFFERLHEVQDATRFGRIQRQ